MTLFELSQQLVALRKKEAYTDVLKLFEAEKGAFSPAELAGNGFMWTAIMKACRETGMRDRALNYRHTFFQAGPASLTAYALTPYAWLVRDALLSDKDYVNAGDEARRLWLREGMMVCRALHTVKDTAGQPVVKGDFGKTAHYFLFTALLKAEKSRNNPDYERMHGICTYFKPDELDHVPSTFTDKFGKTNEMASEREAWYAAYTLSSAETRRHDAVIALTTAALDMGKLHHDNHIWFRRRRALAYQQLERWDEALKDMLFCVRLKKDFFLLSEISAIYLHNQQFDIGLAFLAQALHKQLPDEGLRVNVWETLARVFEANKDMEMAARHYRGYVLLRMYKNWPVTGPQMERWSSLKAALQGSELPPPHDVGAVHAAFTAQRKELMPYWQKWKQPLDRKKGTVNSGKKTEKGTQGTLRTSEGVDYPFFLPSKAAGKLNLFTGAVLTFFVEYPAQGKPKAHSLEPDAGKAGGKSEGRKYFEKHQKKN